MIKNLQSQKGLLFGVSNVTEPAKSVTAIDTISMAVTSFYARIMTGKLMFKGIIDGLSPSGE